MDCTMHWHTMPMPHTAVAVARPSACYDVQCQCFALSESDIAEEAMYGYSYVSKT